MNRKIKYLLFTVALGLSVNLVFGQSTDLNNQKLAIIDSALFLKNPNKALNESISQISGLFLSRRDSLASQYCSTYCDLLVQNGQLNVANKLAKTAKELAPKNTSSEAITLRISGTLNLKLGNFDLAKLELEKALKLSVQIRGDLSDLTASIKINLASVYMRLGVYEAALKYYQESLAVIESLSGKDDATTQKIYDNIGIIYTYMGKFDEAIKSQKEGIKLSLMKTKIDSVELATSYSNLAFSYGQMGDNYKAVSLYMKNLEISRRHLSNDHYLIVRAYNNMGSILTRMGDFNRALNYHKEALHLIQSNNDNVSNPDLGVTYLNLGACSQHTGAYEKGIDYYKKALNFDLKSLHPTHPFIAEDLSYLGDCHFKAKRYDSAILYHEKALAINLSHFGDNHLSVAADYDNLSRDYQYLEDHEAALRFSEKAIFAAQSPSKVNYQLAKSLNQKVRVLLDLGETEIAQKELQRAFIANTHENHLVTWINYPKQGYFNLTTFMSSLFLLNEALCDLSENSYIQSIQENHLQMIGFIDSMVVKKRLSHHNFDDKLQFSKASSSFYKRTVNHLIKLYSMKGDHQFLEMAYLFTIKSNNAILRENLAIKAARQFVGIPDSLNARESGLRSLVSFYQNQLNQLTDSTALPAIQKNLFRYEEELIKLNDSIAENFPQYKQLVNPEEISLEGIMDNIKDNQVLIEYFLSDSTLHIFQIRNNRIKHNSVVYDQLLKEEIKELITQINSPFDASSIITFKHVSYQLYKKLLEGALSKADNIEDIVLIPSYDLPPFPLEVLISDSTGTNYKDLQYLLKKFNFSYAYSSEIKYHKQVGEAKVIAFAPGFESGDSINSGRAGLTNLHWNKSEAESVKTHFPCEIYANEKATEQVLKSKQDEYTILHLATHAILDTENPINSSIAFSVDEKDDNEDGFLHVFEILSMNINANLSVLSACNTGLGEYKTGEGIMSLARAFTYAGCQSVLLSHWSIDDQSTPQMMDRFYAGLKAGDNKGEALKNAKLNFLENASEIRSHPYYWSGLSLYGDISPVQTTSKKQLILAISILVLIGFVIAFMKYKKRIHTP